MLRISDVQIVNCTAGHWARMHGAKTEALPNWNPQDIVRMADCPHDDPYRIDLSFFTIQRSGRYSDKEPFANLNPHPDVCYDAPDWPVSNCEHNVTWTHCRPDQCRSDIRLDDYLGGPEQPDASSPFGDEGAWRCVYGGDKRSQFGFAGGAIHAIDAHVEVNNSRLSQNAAFGNTGGGAIYLRRSNLSMARCAVDGNEALALASNLEGAEPTLGGGAILHAESNAHNVLHLNECNITDNVMSAGNDDASGGGLRIKGMAKDVVLDTCIVRGNRIDTGTGSDLSISVARLSSDAVAAEMKIIDSDLGPPVYADRDSSRYVFVGGVRGGCEQHSCREYFSSEQCGA